METWRAIPGFEGRYEVSDHGRVQSLDRYVQQRNRWGKPMQRFEPGRLLRTKLDRHGYVVHTARELPTVLVHRLVAMAFIPNPDQKPQVNHINGDVVDNRPANLEWCTNSENHLHAYRMLGREPNRSGQKRVALTAADGVARIFPSAVDAATAIGVAPTAVTNAARDGWRCQGHKVEYV